jgi:hypothetical protein
VTVDFSWLDSSSGHSELCVGMSQRRFGRDLDTR